MSVSRIKRALKGVGSTIKVLKRDHREFTSVAGLLDYVASATYKNVYRDAVKSLEDRERELRQEIDWVEKELSHLERDKFYFENLGGMKSKLNELEGMLYRVKNSPCDFVSLGSGIDWMASGSVDMYSPHRLERKFSKRKKVLKNVLKSGLETLEKNCLEYEEALGKARLEPEKKEQIESIYVGFMKELDSVFSDEELEVFMGPILRRIREELSKEMKILQEITDCA